MRTSTAKLQKAPAFQYYPKDLLASPKVTIMTTEEFGGFWLLCSYSWLSDPQGTLPNDDRLLARLARMSDETWTNHRPAIMALFILNGELWELPQLLDELRKQQRWREKSREGGIKSGKVRRGEQEGVKSKGGSTTVEPKGNSAVCRLPSASSTPDINPLTPTNGGIPAILKGQGLRANGANPRAIAAKLAKAREQEKQRRQWVALHDNPPEDQLPTPEDIRKAKEVNGLDRFRKMQRP